MVETGDNDIPFESQHRDPFNEGHLNGEHINGINSNSRQAITGQVQLIFDQVDPIFAILKSHLKILRIIPSKKPIMGKTKYSSFIRASRISLSPKRKLKKKKQQYYNNNNNTIEKLTKFFQLRPQTQHFLFFYFFNILCRCAQLQTVMLIYRNPHIPKSSLECVYSSMLLELILPRCLLFCSFCLFLSA